MSADRPDGPDHQYWWQLPAPAKLNLFLHVLGRREDGYHDIQTVFRFIGLCDTVCLRRRADGEIRRLVGPDGVPETEDLAVRAARLLRRETGARAGADVVVEKRIPVGAGLGGGSSDAAAVLLGLDRLWGTGLGTDALAELALGLGADVPVFVRGRAAFASGVGERLAPLDLPQSWYLVVHPGQTVSTREVFESPELTRNSPPTTIRGFLERTHGPETPLYGGNDCEPVVRAMSPEVAVALDWLTDRDGLRDARLSGTGSCVFAVAEDEATARRVAEEVPSRWTAWALEGLDRSPLLDALERQAQDAQSGSGPGTGPDTGV